MDLVGGGRGRGGSSLVIQKAGSMKFLTEYPQALFAKGNFIKVPFIGGITRDEGTSFFASMKTKIIPRKSSADPNRP